MDRELRLDYRADYSDPLQQLDRQTACHLNAKPPGVGWERSTDPGFPEDALPHPE